MADMGMAKAVLDHAETYIDCGGWHRVTDFWSAEDILAELESAELASGQPITLDTAAIAHFTRIADPPRTATRH